MHINELFDLNMLSTLLATARQDGSLKRNSLPQIFLHRLTPGSMDWLCDQALQAVVLIGALLGSVSLCPLHDFCFLVGCSPSVIVHQQSTKPGNQNWHLEPKHAQPSLTGPGKIAFNQSMEWLEPDDCSIGCNDFLFVDVTEAPQMSGWIWWGEWQVLSMRVFLYV